MKLLIEGADGSGKGTQIALLKNKLGFAHFKYPTSSFPILGEYLEKKRELSPQSRFLLFLADIANEQGKLAETPGLCVIDRYVMSTIAYDTHYPYEKAKSLVSGMGFLRPDIVVLLDLPPGVACQRKKGQKEKEGKSPDRYDEDLEFLKHVRERFLKLMEDSFLCDKWVVLDATKPPEELHNEIMGLIKGKA